MFKTDKFFAAVITAALIACPGFGVRDLSAETPEVPRKPGTVQDGKYTLAGERIELETVRSDPSTGVALLAVPGAPELGYYSPVREGVDVFFTPLMLNAPHRELTLTERQLLHDILEAESSIDFAIYGLNRDSLVRALRQAAERGVEIRIVGNEGEVNPRYVAAFEQFENYENIAVSYTNPSGLMHNKFLVIDRETVWTGTQNMTDTGFTMNVNQFFRIRSAELAAVFRREFDQLHAGLSRQAKEKVTPDAFLGVRGMEVRVVVSPYDDYIGVIEEAIAGAEEYLYFTIFAFSVDSIAEAMAAAADPADGREVRIVGAYDALFAGREWSTYRILDIEEVDGRAVDIELITRKGRGKLHLKTMSLDGETVITGSTNWSAAGAVRNDELMLVIRCGNFAAAYNLYFQKIYRKYTGRELPEREASIGGKPPAYPPEADACKSGRPGDISSGIFPPISGPISGLAFKKTLCYFRAGISSSG